jgi:hypothetical protein
MANKHEREFAKGFWQNLKKGLEMGTVSFPPLDFVLSVHTILGSVVVILRTEEKPMHLEK